MDHSKTIAAPNVFRFSTSHGVKRPSPAETTATATRYAAAAANSNQDHVLVDTSSFLNSLYQPISWAGRSVAGAILAVRNSTTAKANAATETDVPEQFLSTSGDSVHTVSVDEPTLSQYINDFGGLSSKPLEAALAFTTCELHDDPTGADPHIFSVFLLPFLLRLVYVHFSDAFVAVAILYALETLVWMLRSAVFAKHHERTRFVESRWMCFLSDAAVILAALLVGSYVLSAVPGLHSVWHSAHAANAECSRHHHHNGVWLLWGDCMEWPVFLYLVALFLLVGLGVFRRIYAYSLILCATALPIVALLVTEHGEKLTLYNSLLFATLSSAYFLAWNNPFIINGSYTYNLTYAALSYIFIVSLLVGFIL